MIIDNAKYADASNNFITAVVDGVLQQIPAQNDNRLYAEIIGNNVHIAAYSAQPLTSDDVVVEGTRRLALGFAYDFGDQRGVHQIGTTPSDMTGWREVIDYANALIDLGDTTTQISIVTDTGPTLVTAPEWQAVMLHAAEVRQLLWSKSFALQAMSPIPSDFANDSYWT